MHEMAITQSVVDAVCEHAAGRRVHSVKLEIGELCAVVPDSMQFCFELATQGTVADGALLDLERAARRGPLPHLSTTVRVARPDPAVPVRKCRCRSAGRPRPADPLDGSELTMCATCGCGDDGAVITVGRPRTRHHDTTTRPRPRPRRRPHPHRDDLAGAEGSREERSARRAEPAMARRARRPRAQRHQLTGRGQDDPSRAHHPRVEGRPARSPSSKAIRRRCSTPNESAPRARGRSRSTPAPAATSTPTWCTAPARARTGIRVAAVHRERRQSGLPGAVRPRRAQQSGGHLGDRRRGQAAQVSAHVCRGRARHHQQDRSVAVCGLRS